MSRELTGVSKGEPGRRVAGEVKIRQRAAAGRKGDGKMISVISAG